MIEDLINKQQELMLKVPHTVRPDSFMRMEAGVGVIDTLLRFLNSTAHKPWRPVPLPSLVQDKILEGLEERVRIFVYTHRANVDAGEKYSGKEHYSRQLISAYGVIEETIEYVNSLSDGSDRAHRLEELTDSLFFFMEQMILGEFTWSEVEKEYLRKWEVNMERYRRAKENDYGWDNRQEGKL